MIAKLDAVLLDGERTAIPAELKSGNAPDPESRYTQWAPGAWDADALHVAIQAMALERAGYTVPRAELYYRASRTRVLVTLTAELRAEALRAIAVTREAQHAKERPPPLVDSPKCRGCSLVEVCLPDESRLLREGLPADDGLDEHLDAPPEPTQERTRLGGVAGCPARLPARSVSRTGWWAAHAGPGVAKPWTMRVICAQRIDKLGAS